MLIGACSLVKCISMDFLCLRSTISSMSFAPNSIKTNTCHNPSSICLLFFGKYPLTKPIFMTPDVDSAKKLPQILSVCPFSGSALFQLIIISSRVSRWMSSFLVVIISKLPGKSLNVKGHKEKRQQPQTHTHTRLVPIVSMYGIYWHTSTIKQSTTCRQIYHRRILLGYALYHQACDPQLPAGDGFFAPVGESCLVGSWMAQIVFD